MLSAKRCRVVGGAAAQCLLGNVVLCSPGLEELSFNYGAGLSVWRNAAGALSVLSGALTASIRAVKERVFPKPGRCNGASAGPCGVGASELCWGCEAELTPQPLFRIITP